MAFDIASRFIKGVATPRYIFAALAVAVAAGLRLALDPILGTYSPYLPFVAAVLLAARLGGRGPALAATALSSLTVCFVFLEPRYSFRVSEPYALLGCGLFAVLGVAISFLETSRHLRPGRVAASREHAYSLVGTPLVRRIGVLAAAALVLGFLASMLWSGFQRTADAGRQVELAYETLNASGSLWSALEEAESSERGYLLTGDDQYLESYRSAIESERRSRSVLRRLTNDNHAQQSHLDEFDRVVKERVDVLESSLLAYSRHADPVHGMRGHHRCKELVDRLRAILDSVDDEERLQLQREAVAVRTEDARTRWILGLGSGSMVLLLVVAGAVIERHLHARKLAEKVLEQQARLIDLSHDAIITADGDRAITGWNAGAQEMYGWSGKEAAGKKIHELLHTGSDIGIEEIDRILARQERWDGELVHTRADGRVIVTESRHVLLRDDAGQPVSYLEINRDITTRKQVQAALQAGEKHYRTLFESMNEGLALCEIVCDEAGRPCDGRYLAVNPAIYRHTGMKPGDFVGKTILELFPAADRLLIELYGKVALTGEPVRFDAWFEPLGRCFDLGVFQTEPGRFGVVFTDITARKQAEDHIRKLNAELEQRVLDRTAQLAASNKELEAFAYSVSHDLRAPLRGIDGWSLALAEDYGDRLEPRALEYLSRVRSETQRMGRLIDDLLQLSRITRAEMHCDAADLSRTAETIAARLREAHPERSLEFIVRPGLTALGDARLLEIALTNLLQNAVKFTGPRTHARIEFEAVPCNGKSGFVVRDNGVGFDMAYTGNLFGAFQRLHSESEFPGTGIGLATVQRVIHRHGGRIWAEAEPGRGAAFYFTLGSDY